MLKLTKKITNHHLVPYSSKGKRGPECKVGPWWIIARSSIVSRRVSMGPTVGGASCPCECGLAGTQSFGIQFTITTINGVETGLGSACGKRYWRSTKPSSTCHSDNPVVSPDGKTVTVQFGFNSKQSGQGQGIFLLRLDRYLKLKNNGRLSTARSTGAGRWMKLK